MLLAIRHATTRRRAIAVTSVVVAMMAATATAAIAVPRTTEDGASSGDRVLQSVDVAMAPDGTLRSIEGTTVTSADGHDADSTSTSYSPESVVSHLPVRVLTAYQTSDGSGTDLSDLDGYTGTVHIDLTVQNLTVRPQNLTYDVDGASRTQPALVGAPLTVVASTALDDVDPSAVVTNSDNGAPVTNGVLSKGSDGTTQVQWATILAPPQLAATTHLSLVLDAKDFKVPSFDLSVQPGLVTDPSVGSLVDAAFQPGKSSEMQLEYRAVDLATQVNTVLARASRTISQVRSTLDSSARTLGTKTVSDLRASTSGLASSMKTLDGTLRGLGSDISQSLKSTRSETLAQLQQTVRAVDGMLGDTSVKPPTAKVSDRGCEATVKAPGKAGSVYGSLLQVVSQLDGYARATGGCKTALRTAILTSAGPAHPDAASCAGASTSISCALFQTGEKFNAVADKLTTDADKAVGNLQADAYSTATGAATALRKAVTAAEGAFDAVDKADPTGSVKPDYTELNKKLDEVAGARDTLAGAIGDLQQKARDGEAAATALGTQNTAAAQQVCDLLDAGRLDQAGADALRGYLTGTSCPDADGSTHPLRAPTCPTSTAPPAWCTSTDAQITAQHDAWQALADASDPATVLAPFDDALDAVRHPTSPLITLQVKTGKGDLGDALKTLRDLLTKDTKDTESLDTITNHVVDHVATLADERDALESAVRTSFGDAAGDVRNGSSATVDDQVGRVTSQAQSNADQLGGMLDRSAKGLTSAADAIRKDGAHTVAQQHTQLGKDQTRATLQISHSVDGAIAQIGRGVAGSTRNLKAASALLAQDLRRVMLDLGDRHVRGSGLLGSMAAGAATAGSADYQLALATRTATSYANVRNGDIAGLLLRQAQTRAALQLGADLPVFGNAVPQGTEHRTIYSFHLGAGE